jgi:hypothetical protein
MKVLQIGGIIVATAITAACLTAMGKKVIDVRPSVVAETEVSSGIAPLEMPEEPPKVEPLTLSEENSGPKEVQTHQATSEDALSVQIRDQTGLQEDFSLREKQQVRWEEDGDDFAKARPLVPLLLSLCGTPT